MQESSDYDPEWIDDQAKFVLKRDYIPLLIEKLDRVTNPRQMRDKMREYISEFAARLDT